MSARDTPGRGGAGDDRDGPDALRSDATTHDDPDTAVAGPLVESADGAGVCHYPRDEGELWQLPEYVAHRSHAELFADLMSF
ncbi:hypothetical protein KN815_20855 [Streptomyces sp. 4503]|uniref:Uncharacterized protein n=1 Tax=Streptomyces niphimycinicus TaxID=2842201 RepID=A0ABS6CHP6_9ACTN|nr:hypothetical protein [Streptomyces niphimycinicus]